MTLHDLERVLYFDAYIVVNPGDSELEEKSLIEEEDHRELLEKYPDLELGMGAEVVKQLLESFELHELNDHLR